MSLRSWYLPSRYAAAASPPAATAATNEYISACSESHVYPRTGCHRIPAATAQTAELIKLDQNVLNKLAETQNEHQ